MDKNALKRLLDVAEEDERAPIVYDNPDIDEIIIPAFQFFLINEQVFMAEGAAGFANLLRVMIETVYLLGYKAGREAECQNQLLQSEDGSVLTDSGASE